VPLINNKKIDARTFLVLGWTDPYFVLTHEAIFRLSTKDYNVSHNMTQEELRAVHITNSNLGETLESDRYLFVNTFKYFQENYGLTD